jgi:radical SAM superfamily enzyme YgiQ (UPF0313 family)
MGAIVVSKVIDTGQSRVLKPARPKKILDIVFVKPYSDSGAIQIFGSPFMLPASPAATVAPLVATGHNVRIIDENVEPLSFSPKPDVVMIGFMTSEAESAYRVAIECIKKGIPVILGGPHPTSRPEEASMYGTVVQGAIEPWLPQLIDDFISGELRDIYPLEGRADLDKLCFPAYNLLKLNRYHQLYSLEHLRGCGKG